MWTKKNVGSENFFGLQNFESKKMGVHKKFWSTKIKASKSLGPKSFVKIGKVSAEIFLIWTIFLDKSHLDSWPILIIASASADASGDEASAK